jgi:polyketide synthase 12/myxalamid-type polyketide synthase MxaB/epothilone polyketide synthase D
LSESPADPIAIVGIGCRFPGADGPAEFWKLIRDGGFAVREVPEHRVELGFNIHDVYDPRPGTPGKIGSPRYGFLDHPELFDPLPFGLTPRDAVGMEPQQRLVVEVVWNALEDAGIPPDSLEGERVAVMIGHMAEDYSREQIAVLGEERYRRSIDVWAAAGIARAAVSGRVSFLLGVRGPSFTIDTACSSSLLTVHLACQSLWSGESRYAIAGGVNVFLSPEGMIALSRVGMLARDGKCKAFDDSADGFVRSEGAGVVVLRPLADALAANDPIYAVIRGTGFSADGRDGGHMMAPGRHGQVQAMRDAYQRAQIDPATVDFVETHGTGTVIGDPVEIQALADVMAPGRAPDRPLKVSSVKGNIGHAESASGIAGLIKAALAVHHRALPKQLHFETPSKAIPWDEVPIRVQTEHEAFPEGEPLRVGVNSFGISGTNAHAILDERPAAVPVACSSSRDAAGETPRLFVVSGHSPEALRGNAQSLAQHIREQAELPLRDVGYTLARRRSHRSHRLSLVAASADELAAELDAFVAGAPSPGASQARCDRAHETSVGMVFSGHGSHWFGMGTGLFARQPVFREALEEWDAALRPHVDWSLVDVLRADPEVSILERVDVLQSAVAGIAIALARLWQHAGIRPAHVVGHSVGEIAAAHVAGCLSLADAARVACERGRAIREHAGPGAMGVVACAADALLDELALRREHEGERVWVAGANAPSLTIVSGEVAAVERLLADLEARGEFARRLNVEYASHCPSMAGPGDALAASLDGIRPMQGEIPFFSTVTGERLDGAELGADYWGRNLRAPVLLTDAVAAMLAGGSEALLEVSPHPVLAAALSEIVSLRADGEAPAPVFGSLRRDENEEACWLASLGGLFTHGCPVDFELLHPSGRVAPMPLYAYQRREFWFGPKRGSRRTPEQSVFSGLLGVAARGIESATEPDRRYWQIELADDSFGDDHRIGGVSVLPEGELARMALAAADELWPEGAGALESLRLEAPLALPAGPRSLQLTIERGDACDESARVAIASRAAAESDHADGAWLRHASARVWRREAEDLAAAPALDWSAALDLQDAEHFYTRLAQLGIEAAAERRCIERVGFVPGQADLRAHGDEAFAELKPDGEAYGLAPLLDACWQLLVWAGEVSGRSSGPLRPDGVDEFVFAQAPAEVRGLRVVLRPSEDELVADAELIGSDAKQYAVVRGLRARVDDTSALASTGPWRYERRWRSIEWPAAAANEPDTWLVAGEDAALCARVRIALDASGRRVCELAPARDLRTALEAALAAEPELAWGVVVTAPPADAKAPATAAGMLDAIEQLVAPLRDLPAAQPPRVWLTTSDGQAPAAGQGEGSVVATAVWEQVASLARGAEAPPVRCVDLSGCPSELELAGLAELLVSQLPAACVALRERELLAPRFEHAPLQAESPELQALVSASGRPFSVRVGDTDRLDAIDLAEALPCPPGPGEVQVAVRAAGLCFLDVLASMGAGRTAVGEALGWECAGVVSAIGDDVVGFEVGDPVFGFARGAATSHVCTPAALLARKPRGLSDEAAAAAPLAEVVARYALERIARLRVGDRVAVHSAGGAIGQAAVALASRRGARVVATAGSERKRAVLLELGAEQVFDSRASQLVRSLGRWAGESGLDIVFDLSPERSLGEREAIFDRLAPGARFIALDHPRASAAAVAATGAAGRNLSLHRIDPIGLLETKPEELGSVLREVARELSRREIAIPAPTVFPVAQSMRALRYVSQARHVGKVVLSLDASRDLLVRPVRSEAEATSWLDGAGVLVVGAETGPGRQLCSWLEQAGARVEAIDPGAAQARLGAAGFADAAGAVVAIDAGQPPAELERSLEAARLLVDVTCDACLQFAWLATDDASLVGDGGCEPASALLGAYATRAASLGIPVSRVRLSASLSAAPDPASFTKQLEAAGGHSALLGTAPEAWTAEAASAHPWLAALGDAACASDGEASLQLTGLDAEAREDAVRGELASALGRVLHLGGPMLEQLDWSCAANDLGLDSLMALELKLVLEARLDVELELASLFDGTSLAELAVGLARAAGEER